MKCKILILAAAVGVLTACSSDRTDYGNLDSDRVDTSQSAPSPDTASLNNGATDTATLPKDTTP